MKCEQVYKRDYRSSVKMVSPRSIPKNMLGCRKHHTRWSRHGNPDIKLKGGKPRRYCNLV
jgi:hypothetical protein